MAMKQYIGASTQWHEDEVSRRRRVAEANRAAYDEARDAERGVRGGSVFSYTPRESVGAPDGVVGTASNTVVGPQTGNMPIRSEWDVLDSQARIGSEFADLARRSAAVRQHNARIGVDSISAAMRSARSNGGRLPQNAVDMLSRNLGLDGRTSAVYGAGYLGNGDFDIDIVTRGANGGLQRTTKKITPLEQYNMMLASPGIWGEDGVAASQGLYNRLRNTRGKSELQAPSVYEDNLRAYNTQMQAQTSQKDMLSAMKMLMDYEQKSKAPMSAEQFLRTMPKSVLEMAFPPRYEEGSDPNDPERPTKPYTPQEIAERTNELMESLRSRASGNDGERSDPVRDTLIAGLRKLSGLDAPQVPDDIRDFQQRQRERQMRQVEDAQARADITQRPQQLINYFKDGRWYSGNGYIRDGKVYDGQGYEIEGATPAEMARGNDGGVVSNERGWFARALPSARELVSGGAGGGNAGEGASQVAQQPAAQATQGEQPVATQPAQVGQTQPAAAQEQTGAQQGSEAEKQGWRPKTPDEIAKVKAEIASRKAKVGEGEKTNAQLEREAMEREESLFSQIRQNGGRLFNDENGHRYIDVGGGFGKLPNDSPLRSKLDENGYYDIDAEGHSIEDAVKLQGEVLKVVQELAKKKDDFNRRRAAAAAAFHRDALKAHPNDSKRRQEQERRMMEGWLKDNDPDYEKKRSRVARERAQQRFNSDDLLGSEVLSSDIQ